MSSGPCDQCRNLLVEYEEDGKLADKLEAQFPQCQCEQFSVGIGSPGRVADDETLHRFIISPRDFDPASGTILSAPFEKVFSNGLSVCRALATEQEMTALIEEGLAHSADEECRQIWAACEAITSDLRQMRDDQNERLFCIYDQTVSRADSTKPPVPTHAGIFLRRPPKGTKNGKVLRKDFAGRLREQFIAKQQKLEEVRDGLLCVLNDRAKNGEFRSG